VVVLRPAGGGHWRLAWWRCEAHPLESEEREQERAVGSIELRGAELAAWEIHST
jgi:hypothetical protein